MRYVKVSSLFLLILVFAAASARAQDLQAEKRLAIAKMLTTIDVRTKMADLFKTHIALYEATFPDAVIAHDEAIGLFKGLPPDRAAKMKDLIHELAQRLTRDLQQRIVDEVVTQQTIDSVMVPVYDA